MSVAHALSDDYRDWELGSVGGGGERGREERRDRRMDDVPGHSGVHARALGGDSDV